MVLNLGQCGKQNRFAREVMKCVCWRRMYLCSAYRPLNEEVLPRVKKEKNILGTIKGRRLIGLVTPSI
jgi:hypothetical protein